MQTILSAAPITPNEALKGEEVYLSSEAIAKEAIKIINRQIASFIKDNDLTSISQDYSRAVIINKCEIANLLAAKLDMDWYYVFDDYLAIEKVQKTYEKAGWKVEEWNEVKKAASLFFRIPQASILSFL